MRENRFHLFLNRLRLLYSIPKSFALLLAFHTARHTFATMMLTLGADLYTTSKLLGHADVKMTQVYAKIINQKKDDAVNLVNGLFD
ncbi:tyrosine-type recombinase/integrase [Phocaeicola dorei]|uniref:tyrosine-type recombinase/integrase n=1 Tax=Phocaeicola dorei TaxID=357276 RepID=UPI00355C4046